MRRIYVINFLQTDENDVDNTDIHSSLNQLKLPINCSESRKEMFRKNITLVKKIQEKYPPNY